MQATHPDGLNRRFLIKRTEFGVELLEQGKICPGIDGNMRNKPDAIRPITTLSQLKEA